MLLANVVLTLTPVMTGFVTLSVDQCCANPPERVPVPDILTPPLGGVFSVALSTAAMVAPSATYYLDMV